MPFNQVWTHVRAELARHGYKFLDDSDKRVAEGAFRDGLDVSSIVNRCLRYIRGDEFSLGC